MLSKLASCVAPNKSDPKSKPATSALFLKIALAVPVADSATVPATLTGTNLAKTDTRWQVASKGRFRRIP